MISSDPKPDQLNSASDRKLARLPCRPARGLESERLEYSGDPRHETGGEGKVPQRNMLLVFWASFLLLVLAANVMSLLTAGISSAKDPKADPRASSATALTTEARLASQLCLTVRLPKTSFCYVLP